MSARAAKAEETAAATAETKTMAAPAGNKETAEPVAYLGPDIKNVAINGTVYTGGLPEALKEKIKETPAIKGLLVPVSDLAAAGVAVATKGTALNTLYSSVRETLKAEQK